jgi:hypothetical protein
MRQAKSSFASIEFPAVFPQRFSFVHLHKAEQHIQLHAFPASLHQSMQAVCIIHMLHIHLHGHKHSLYPPHADKRGAALIACRYHHKWAVAAKAL